MRQSSLGVIQRVEARYRLAVEVRSGWPRWGKSRSGMAVEVGHSELGSVGVCCVKLLRGSRGKSWPGGVCSGKL